MKRQLLRLMFLSMLLWSSYSIGQTPNNCGNYTSTGTSSASGYADPNAACGANVPGTITGGTAAWTGSSCSGTIVSTVTGPPVTCLTVSYGAVNTNDYGTLSTDTGGSLTITAVNAAVNGNVVGPYNCGSGSYGNVLVTVCSTVPFSSLTLLNTGCTSGWVINCATAPCDPSWTPPTPCSDDAPIDLSSTVTGDAGGTWSGTGITGTSFDPSVGTQSITYTAPCGDVSTQTITVTQAGNPAWTPPANVCQNDAPIDLNTLITGDIGGTWSGTGVTGNMFNPSSGSQSVTYDVGTSPCNNTLTQTINVTPALDPSWTSPGTICEAAGSIDLNTLITGDTGGTWSGNGVSGNTFNPAGLVGPIAVTYTIGTAPCIGTDQQTITVIPDVDPSWNPPTGVCNTDGPVDLNTLITGTAGGTWSGTGVSGNMFDPANGTQDVTYTIGVAPCVETSTQTITIGTTPDPSWTTMTLCASDAPVDLNNSVTGTAGGTWTGNGVSGSMFNPSGGTQNITYTVVNGVCSANSAQNITVVDPLLTTTTTNVTCYGDADGSMGVTVAGGSGTYTYSWSTAPPQTSATATNVPAGTYTVTVTDGACIVTADVTIIQPDSVAAFLTPMHSCAPELAGASVSATGGVGAYTYVWNNTTQTTATVSDLDSAMHTVTVTDGNGCSYTDSVLVNIYQPPTITITPDTVLTYGDEAQLYASGGVSYNWTPDTDLSCSDCPDPIANPLQDTYYCVTGEDVNGCIATECMTMFVEIVCGDIFVPSAFTPNNDGENDVLCVYSDCMKTMSFRIYNRWGEKVYESGSLNICWDGTWNGKMLNSAVFVYVLEGYLINGEPVDQKGNISLIR
ncbi:gliding motility-associated C-terminal domain-containing protein [Paracrocinitomix mangrovi]|uniref:T9SS type B sorting domain-containing protein n=1 Tax=Paracrocinitomix mangrovi TaxID=2862509 RepID=UPI001C8DA8E6|nr:gliding motility-associated C-terminal domain-containing protein [Paracrocinitomix mangrovi]UKN02910.1 gliding motility-associated C-terminal domain-containing protein [Paracrocinitomix mangrovi]